ncbi:MAG: protein kinase [Archangiaceae bacterium]|nr:protein kinase [Archangiaceae bacterium]
MTVELLRVGSTIGDHRIVKKLGEGAMGAVFEGVHGLIGKRVAIKVLKNHGEEGRIAAKRLLEEARAVNAIDHKGVIDIFDAGLLADGRPYLVMELLVGRSLHEEVKRSKGGLPMRLVLHVLKGVLEGLQAAHGAGVIHRDLKASNVFLVDQPQGMPLVKLVDFGIARRVGRSEVLTMPSMTVGSMGFMAPEHIAGRPVAASDLYAVGCLAWLMLTGRPVFPYGNPGVLVQQHLEETPPPVGSVRKETSPELDAWVGWLLEKRAEDRPHSAEVALLVLHEAELAVDGIRTAPGGPSFIDLAKDYDARAREQSGVRQQVTDVSPAYSPEPPIIAAPVIAPPRPRQKLKSAPKPSELPSLSRGPRVLTASRRKQESRADETSDDDTVPPAAPPLGAFDSDTTGTVIEPPSGVRRKR